MLIAIDGIDGAGKTTLAEELKVLLAPLNPIIEKEPTEHSEWGRALKESAGSGRLERDKELEYFHKDRVQHLSSIVVPALESGRVVILDRYIDSTLAYQADSPSEAESLYQTFLPEIRVPDITFILDCDPAIGLRRIATGRNGNSKFEKLHTLSAAQKIYKSRRGPTYVHIDAEGDKKNTLEQAVGALRTRFDDLKEILDQASEKKSSGHETNFEDPESNNDPIISKFRQV